VERLGADPANRLAIAALSPAAAEPIRVRGSAGSTTGSVGKLGAWKRLSESTSSGSMPITAAISSAVGARPSRADIRSTAAIPF
jgi:hypothetical protein